MILIIILFKLPCLSHDNFWIFYEVKLISSLLTIDKYCLFNSFIHRNNSKSHFLSIIFLSKQVKSYWKYAMYKPRKSRP